MNIFFDTSSLFKLYHKEAGTDILLEFLDKTPNYNIYLSELTLVEIYSAILKKVRMGHLSKEESQRFLALIDRDIKEYLFVPLNLSILHQSQQLILDYGLKGLRSLDAIQLASAITVKSSIDLVLTGDNTLKSIFIAERFNCDIDAL